MDFTITIYNKLLFALYSAGYAFQTFEAFIKAPKDHAVVMRHDVDRKPMNAVRMATLENELGISATYYFRSVPFSWDKKSIVTIASLGHEIGYHYEDLAIKKGNKQEAISHFSQQLERFRKLYPVSTICMHGSPLSKWDNRTLWETYNYHDYGIIAEPYFDVDYNEVCYITDAGRALNKPAVNRRDSVQSELSLDVKHTKDLIHHIKHNAVQRLIINIHPEHWAESKKEWLKIYAVRAVKNTVKRIVLLGN